MLYVLLMNYTVDEQLCIVNFACVCMLYHNLNGDVCGDVFIINTAQHLVIFCRRNTHTHTHIYIYMCIYIGFIA